ncbi:MAG: ImmA/IrrE family metallo-endopeptidase, partial [Gammaproteobacteria bacterium]|nr:ImmA/IrrE family metallo-endopeptidase [Gammaproteobacteria bacterium]
AQPIIEFNPHQVRARVRFSIAHEVAHLLFSDWHCRTRNRSGDRDSDDTWQLELLCNLAAAEFVLPIGSLTPNTQIAPIEDLMQQCCAYDVSVEAFFIRLVKVSAQPTIVFFASPRGDSDTSRSYRIDYFVASRNAPAVHLSNRPVPDESVVTQCTAIGYTNRAEESWVVGTRSLIECVGIPAYPGRTYPRVATLVGFQPTTSSLASVEYFHGNVLTPRGDAPRILCQLVNDQAGRWGGGVAKQMASMYPDAESDFSLAIRAIPRDKRLGQVILTKVDEETTIASLIAQEGYGKSMFPRIRYAALECCLDTLSEIALTNGASVHMPRIGTGSAQGKWEVIEEILDDTLIRAGLTVNVYDSPPSKPKVELF